MAGKTVSKQRENKRSPESYIKLAKISLGLKEFQIAVAACDRGLLKFPDNAGLLVVRGETLVLAYNYGKKSEHLKVAVDSLEKALKINPHNYVAKFLTGQIYLQFKKYKLAAERFSAILEIDPNDTRAKSYLDKAMVKLTPPPATEARTRPGRPPRKEEAPARIPAREKVAAPAEEPKEPLWETVEGDESANHDFLIARLGMFNKLDGVKGILMIDYNGNILKTHRRSDLDPELLSSMAGTVYRSTDRVVERFETGDLLYGMIMCQGANLYIINARWAVLILETTTGTNQEIVEKKISQYREELSL